MKHDINGDWALPESYSSFCQISGGGQQSSGSQSSSQGFRDLPPEIQDSFKDLATQSRGYLPGNNPATAQAFTPLPQTSAETSAISNINQGFTPTASTLRSDINMQTNPYDQSVINTINQQAQGQNSILNQSLNSAGQFGSNRAFLGANDIDLTRLNQIGTFKQQGFNTALQNALTTLPQARAGDASAQLSAGQYQRGLNADTQQAPINALARISQILGVLPTNSGQSSGSNSGSGFNFGLFSSSDRAIKENIKSIGHEKGFPLYEFNYIGDKTRYIGVMAQDVEKTRPDAVREFDGIKAVNYGMIGVKLREAHSNG